MKHFLGGPRSKGDFLSTWRKIEDALNHQLITIASTKSKDRNAIPIEIDRTLFSSVFGVVTWYAMRRVLDHLNTVQYPLKECTGVFTRSMGLPCAHICDYKKVTGLELTDFDQHWYWERDNTREPLQNPVPERIRVADRLAAATARNTDRILSAFERVDPQRTEPMCSSCHQRGHTMVSRNCPNRLRADIELASQRVHEAELARLPTLQLSQEAEVEVLSVAAAIDTVDLGSDDIEPVSAAALPVNPQSSPQPLFIDPQQWFPPSLPEPRYIPQLISPVQPIEPYQPVFGQVPEDRVEVVYPQYLAEKDVWLANNSNFKKKGWRAYRVAKGLVIMDHYTVKYHKRMMEPFRILLPSGAQLPGRANWTLEEVHAWADYQAELDRRVDEQLLGVGRTWGEAFPT